MRNEKEVYNKLMEEDNEFVELDKESTKLLNEGKTSEAFNIMAKMALKMSKVETIEEFGESKGLELFEKLEKVVDENLGTLENITKQLKLFDDEKIKDPKDLEEVITFNCGEVKRFNIKTNETICYIFLEINGKKYLFDKKDLKNLKEQGFLEIFGKKMNEILNPTLKN